MATPASPTGAQLLFPGHPVLSPWGGESLALVLPGRWSRRCGDVTGCSKLPVGSSENSEIVSSADEWKS